MPPDQQTSAQHTAAELAPNRILMFDNRTDSAAAVFARGGVRRSTAPRRDSRCGSGRPPNNNYASAVSSARRLANGNTLIAFGMEKGRNGSSGPTEAYEVTPDGAIAWHLVVDGVMTMFRVEPVNSFEP